MNDLNQLLRDASTSDDDSRLSSQDLLASGRRKVRKAGSPSPAARQPPYSPRAVTGWLRSGDDQADVVDPDGRSAIYEEVRVPIDEVERRCSAVINAPRQTDIEYVTGVSDNRVAVPGAETDQPIDAAEGDIVLMFPGRPVAPGPAELRRTGLAGFPRGIPGHRDRHGGAWSPSSTSWTASARPAANRRSRVTPRSFSTSAHDSAGTTSAGGRC